MSEELAGHSEAYLEGYKKGCEDAKKESGWVSVAERLPEKYGTYICYSSRFMNKFTLLKFRDGVFYWQGNRSAATYWMPLPSFPKDETNE